MFYPFPASIPLWQPSVAAVGLLGATLLVLRLAKSHPALVTGWFWYLGTLVPVLGLVKQGDQAVADRFAYVPSIGLLIMAAFGLSHLEARGAGWRRSLCMAGAVVVALSTLATRRQLENWSSSFTLFSHALAVDPNNYLAHLNLGASLYERGEHRDAAQHFERALALKPNHSKALLNVGRIRADQGDSGAAIEFYRKAALADPGYASAAFNLGLELARVGQWDEAANALSRAITLDPNHVKARVQLGLVLAEQGHTQAAIAELRGALELAPNLAAARGNLAMVLERSGKLQEAIQEYRILLTHDPNDAMGHFGLGAALALQGDVPGALGEYRKAVALRPDWPEPQSRIDALLAKSPP